MLTVFFDGGCPLCSREITHYQTLARDRDILWLDVTREPETLARHGLSLTEALARFHVMDQDGAFHRGADGFILLWSQLPGYRYLAALCTRCHLQPMLRFIYERFARWHFRRRCPEGQCGI